MKIDEYKLNLNIVISLNDRKDAFNYKNEDIKKYNIQISEGFYFVLNKNGDINKISQQSDIKTEKGDHLIFRIRLSKKGYFTIENPLNKKMSRTISNYNSLNNKLWYVLKSSQNQNKSNNLDDYILNKNDIIKFGTSKYEVIEKHIENCNCEDKIVKHNYNINNYNNNTKSLFKMTEIKDAYYSNQTKDNACRICFGEESSIENPKVRLCKCNDYIHYKCLKKWIETNIYKRNNRKKTVLSYILKKFYCDVCKKPYPLKFKISEINKEYSLVDLKIPIQQNYIILESLGSTTHNNNLKIIHIIKLIDKEISFGKKDSCDILDLGTYVSRIHAVIKYNDQNGDVILENKSKNFDTLVLVKNPIQITEKKIDFQVGRTIITSNLTKDK